MRLRFWRCRRPAPPTTLPRRTPDERPAWATAPTEVFHVDGPGRPGRLTRAQEWRADGGRRLPAPRAGEEGRG
ncbi:hypothetical protein [Micromonospora narathiwatensis]|uniref:Uncharacterized protein n=1 Tax=Micromonospora narathiwatensis TaxID=299146 RepID=A0A1A8ZZN0_9ACTN|nr:hypothetical protein [Micromonospora narathiwatensis]SBT49397.1 hypothetical protein GA0070621_3441 [Micromonospora narathiwatensis]